MLDQLGVSTKLQYSRMLFKSSLAMQRLFRDTNSTCTTIVRRIFSCSPSNTPTALNAFLVTKCYCAALQTPSFIFPQLKSKSNALSTGGARLRKLPLKISATDMPRTKPTTARRVMTIGGKTFNLGLNHTKESKCLTSDNMKQICFYMKHKCAW